MPAEGLMGNVGLVFAGGDPPPPGALTGLPANDLVVAADSGLRHALALGVQVDLIVGDMDSVDPDDLDAAVSAGAVLDVHPTAKDATDIELALVAARDRGCTHTVVVGGHGGRLDHFAANLLVLAAPEFAGMRVDALLGVARVVVVHDERELHGEIGDLCTLLPVAGPAHGVRTQNLRFSLHGETLTPGSTRGVSNELLGPVAHVSVDAGVLLAILPDSGRAIR
jgi:thiamine pyrophosphokinase